jgi:hypothetical protein
MTKDEALRLALEALSEAHYVVEHRQDVKKREQAITAIKAALEAKDEPVAWNAGIPSLYPKMKEGETISVEYVELTPPQQDGECKYCTDGCPACDVRKLSEQERFALKHRIAELEGAVIGLQAQRTWVGLTDEELEASKPTRSNDAVVWELAVEWAEAKLKEKNNG